MDSGVSIGNLRVVGIREIQEDSGHRIAGAITLKPNVPGSMIVGELTWYVQSPEMLRRIKLDQKVRMTAPGEMYE